VSGLALKKGIGQNADMTAVQTTAVLEDACHLRLSSPLNDAVGTVVQVIVIPISGSETKPIVNRAPDFYAAVGGYYRDYPDEPRRSSDEWMAELREGEQDECH
jgi:hypothetical protein